MTTMPARKIPDKKENMEDLSPKITAFIDIDNRITYIVYAATGVTMELVNSQFAINETYDIATYIKGNLTKLENRFPEMNVCKENLLHHTAMIAALVPYLETKIKSDTETIKLKQIPCEVLNSKLSHSVSTEVLPDKSQYWILAIPARLRDDTIYPICAKYSYTEGIYPREERPVMVFDSHELANEVLTKVKELKIGVYNNIVIYNAKVINFEINNLTDMANIPNKKRTTVLIKNMDDFAKSI